MSVFTKLLVPAACGALLLSCQSSNSTGKETALADSTAHADSVHFAVFTVDTHVDTPMQMMDSTFDLTETHDAHATGSQVDFPRMKEGGLDAAFFAVYLGQGDRTPEGHAEAKRRALAIFDTIHKAAERHADLAGIAMTADQGEQLVEDGKIAMFIGMENGWPVGNDLSLLKTYYDLGGRYITLSHTSNNDICDSSTDKEGPEYGGLSAFGEEVVKEMNRLGMMVDVSHVSDSTFWDVMALTTAPVIASHSSAYALCDHPRNMKDDMLKRLAENGGVIQVNLLGDYVKKMEQDPARDSAFAALREKYPNFGDLSPEDREKAREEFRALNKAYPKKLPTIADAVDHIDHIVEVAGIDHVGIGADFDGGGGLADCYDVSEYPKLTEELVRRGYSDEDIAKIWGGNLLRVMRAVEQAAEAPSAPTASM
ncbi:membrane dipeptidase [Catalinimonas alkaloidigena]|uniref:Membrane dipeptidase n=1 Tax=Catalinimonas alkaloidigena TaxID=1075417 RepID=A0A1G9N8W9_9BACT|nr:dipeptidase [Catalinimonas alkaloidigena]SDL82761.1 membrane dipeptidase [Catalinimonas alkaloidigena]